MRKLFKTLCVVASTIIFAVAAIFFIFYLETTQYLEDTVGQSRHTVTAIVLGAAILRDGSLSPILKDRVDMAIALYKAAKVDTILVTGNGAINHDEVKPMQKYLLTHGVPKDSILLDESGVDTYSSMYRAKNVLSVTSATVITQSFHLPRAVFIARKLGIDAYGLPSDQHEYLFKNNIREVFANVKAVIDLITYRAPTQ